MRLVVQCSVCGTILTVGTTVCGTCRASGVQNLRLLFECQSCFRLGISPSCEICSQLLSLDPDEVLPEDRQTPALPVGGKAAESASKARADKELIEEELLDADKSSLRREADEISGFELTELGPPAAELDKKAIRFDDKSDSVVEGK